jgi:hypothetical protein
MKEVVRYQFFFNSFKGIAVDNNPSGAYFKVYLNRQLTLINPDNQFVLAVEKVTIPVCFNQFTLDDLSSVLPFTLTDALGTFYTSSISIPNGNYSISDMGRTLTTLLSAELNTVPAMSGVSMNWVFDYNTNRFSLQLIATYPVPFSMTFTHCPITTAIGFTNYLNTTVPPIVANGAFTDGTYNVNMNPIPEIYVTSDTLSDSNSFQCFPIGLTGVQTTASGIVAVIQLEHSSPYYVCKDYKNPTLIPLDRSIIDIIDFDLRDYNGNILYDFDQPWFITFSITEYSNEAIRDENLRTFINVIPPVPLNRVGFLGVKSEEQEEEEEDTQDHLETLKEQLTQSLEKLKSNVQKRKSPSTAPAQVYEGPIEPSYAIPTNESTIASSNAGQTEQTTPDTDGSAKRQRES